MSGGRVAGNPSFSYPGCVTDETKHDVLAEAEEYLEAVRTGGRPVRSAAELAAADDPRETLEELLGRLQRLDAAQEGLGPRGGRQAARLRSMLVGERASIYVAIGATIARWIERGGEVGLSLDPKQRRDVPHSPDDTFDDLEVHDATIGASETLVARAVRQPAPPPRPTIASVLAETRHSVRSVRSQAPDGPPPDILGSDPGVPPEDASPEALQVEAEWLDEQGNLLNRWRRVSAPLQHAVLSWLTARARWAQELLPPGEMSESVGRIYPKLSAFSKRERPGFVYGLRRDHAPQGANWREDAHSWRRQVTELRAQEEAQGARGDDGESNPEKALLRLEEILRGDPESETVAHAVAATLDAGVRPDDPRLLRSVEEHDDALADDPRFKRVRRALRAWTEEDDPDATVLGELPLVDASLFGDSAELPAEEALELDALARELKVLLVGGEPREQHRQRLLEATGVAELEWAPATRGGGTGKLQSTAESIRQGSWDGVILLPRFCGHDVDAILVPACKSSETPWLHVRGGYGIGPMRAAVRDLASKVQQAREEQAG